MNILRSYRIIRLEVVALTSNMDRLRDKQTRQGDSYIPLKNFVSGCIKMYVAINIQFTVISN